MRTNPLIVEDMLCYLRRYPDLQKAFGDDVETARRHYLTDGKEQGRIPSCTPKRIYHGNDDATSRVLSATIQCNDVPPDDEYTCKQLQEKCSESWMAGFCLRTCFKCAMTLPALGSAKRVQALKLRMSQANASGIEVEKAAQCLSDTLDGPQPGDRTFKFDVVYTWLNRTAQYDCEYELKYALRALERFGMIEHIRIRNIYVVYSDTHIYSGERVGPPSFLKRDHPRLKFVPHSEILFEENNLPALNRAQIHQCATPNQRLRKGLRSI